MRFYAVRTEAIQLTQRALQQLDRQRLGSCQPGRALRVATLYGHLQCRADARGEVQLGLRELAAAWCLQRRLLRDDLRDLQALGWLSFCGGPQGTWIQLQQPHQTSLSPQLPAEQPVPPPAAQAAATCPEPLATDIAIATEPVSARAEPSAVVRAKPLHRQWIGRFAVVYNQHRPQTWPVYSPLGTALVARLERALFHAGGEEAFWLRLAAALQGMPEFWRTTYPKGRGGAECAAALLSAGRHAAGLGVEFWNVFSWGAQGSGPLASASRDPLLMAGGGADPAGADQARMAAIDHPDFARARTLLVWGDHAWRCQGMEAFALPAAEKQRLAELLEAAGVGERGHAAKQFAPEPER